MRIGAVWQSYHPAASDVHSQWYDLPDLSPKQNHRTSVRHADLLKMAGIAIFVLFGAALLTEPEGVLQGVSIGGVPAGGLRKSELLNLAKQRATQMQNENITLVTPRHNLTVAIHSLRASFTPEAAAGVAWLLGREPSLLARLRSKMRAWRGLNVPIPVVVSKTILKRLCKGLSLSPQNATVEPLPDGSVRFTAQQPGFVVDMVAAKAKIEKAIAVGQLMVYLPLKTMHAPITKGHLLGITCVRSHVRLRFTSRSRNALHNATLALARLDRAYVKSGGEFSFNKVVGPRTVKAGYLPAPTLFRGRPSYGIAGGVCPVATAIGLALLKAGLKLVERHQHSRTVRYAKPGLDFTVEYPRRDVRFVNTTGAPIVIRASVNGRVINIYVCGAPLQAKVSLVTSQWREGKWLKVTTKRIWTLPDGSKRIEVLFTSRYPAK